VAHFAHREWPTFWAEIAYRDDQNWSAGGSMRRRRATVELFEELRREYEFGVGTVAGVARKFGVHRRLVREALGGALPQERPARTRARPRTTPVAAFIDSILEADRRAPRKQRHTAHRIWVRLGAEQPAHSIAESTVRRYVREAKRRLGLRIGPELCVPQQYALGEEAQVDWYEAVAEVDGERLTLQVFALRSMASGAAFHCAYLRATQQAFLEAHELAFHYLGGVFRRLRYDNLSAAVKKILRGFRREETQRFVAFRSHYGFEATFCTPGEGHEKGGVEGEVGTFRRNHWVPVPHAANLVALNACLLTGCRQDEGRTITGRAQTVGAALQAERAQLLPLPAEGFDLAEVSFARVDGLGCVRVRTNAYSAPLPPGTTAQVKVLAATVEVWHQGRCVARHPRSYGRHQQLLDLEHYLDVLAHKPGALAGSTPLEQWRRAGRWPASYDRFWEELIERQGKQAGTKAMVEVLQLGRTHGEGALRGAVEAALGLGCHDAAAVGHLLSTRALAQEHRCPEALDAALVGALAQYDRPLPEVSAYDQLLSAPPPPRVPSVPPTLASAMAAPLTLPVAAAAGGVQ
jgi:transposase